MSCVLDMLRNCDSISRNHDIAHRTSRASTQLLHCRWKGSRFKSSLLAQEEKVVLVGGTNHRRQPRHKEHNGTFSGRRKKCSLGLLPLSLHCIVRGVMWRRRIVIVHDHCADTTSYLLPYLAVLDWTAFLARVARPVSLSRPLPPRRHRYSYYRYVDITKVLHCTSLHHNINSLYEVHV